MPSVPLDYATQALDVLLDILADEKAEDETRIRAAATILHYLKTPTPKS